MRENVQGKTKIQKLLVSKLLRIDHRLFHNLNFVLNNLILCIYKMLTSAIKV